MILHDGDTVFLTFASYNCHHSEQVWVTECVVIDGANNVVRQKSPYGAADRIRVLDADGVETIHPTEAEAWQQAAAVFAAGAERLTAKADECSRQAAALVVGRAVPA